jgi:hypothetical protein
MSCQKISTRKYEEVANESSLRATYQSGLLMGKQLETIANEDRSYVAALLFLERHGLDAATITAPSQGVEQVSKSIVQRWTCLPEPKQMEGLVSLAIACAWLKRRHTAFEKECRLLTDHADTTHTAHSALLAEHETLEATHRRVSQEHERLLVGSYTNRRHILLLSLSVVYAAWVSAWFCVWASCVLPSGGGAWMQLWVCPILTVGCVCVGMVLGVLVPRWTTTHETRLQRFYTKWNRCNAHPEFIRSKCQQYARNIDTMFNVLVRKYGPEPNPEPYYQALSLATVVVTVTAGFIVYAYKAHRNTTQPICTGPNASTLR